VASPAASSTSWPTSLDGTGRPGILARRPYHGCGFVWSAGPAAHISGGGDEASFTSGVPHYTPPDLAVSAPLLAHTPTLVGSLVKGGVKGWGDDDDDKEGGSPLVTTSRTHN